MEFFGMIHFFWHIVNMLAIQLMHRSPVTDIYKGTELLSAKPNHHQFSHESGI